MSSGRFLALRHGLVYQGIGFDFYAIHPIPVLTSFSLVPEKGQTPAPTEQASLLFREDSFDPVSRVRRGRLYKPAEHADLTPDHVHNYPFGPHEGITGGRWIADAWYASYRRHDAESLNQASPRDVLLGDGEFQTRWRIVAREQIANGDVLLTLRSVTTLGALPAIADQVANFEGEFVNPEPIQDAVNRVADALYVQQPAPIVDVCRESLRIVLAAWLGTEADTHDLAQLVKKVPAERTVIKSAAQIIARLHPRGKSAEQERQKTKGMTLQKIRSEDAETCVQLVGLVLRDIGWAAE